jgi:hypothetical protein
MECTICESNAERVFEHKVLGRHHVAYHLCPNCGFLFTEKPHWLEEAYVDAVSATDTGILRRNIEVSAQVSALLFACFPATARFLDFAGGYGLLTRLMRDAGFDFWWSDRYCTNLFARGFEANEDDVFDAVTAIEVFEHVHEPADLTRRLCEVTSRSPFIVLTTNLYGTKPPDPSWWYYSFETGQHVSFYQRRTLECLAKLNGLHFLSHAGIHVLTRKRLNRRLFEFVVGRASGIARLLLRRCRNTLTFEDHQRIVRTLTSPKRDS